LLPYECLPAYVAATGGGIPARLSRCTRTVLDDLVLVERRLRPFPPFGGPHDVELSTAIRFDKEQDRRIYLLRAQWLRDGHLPARAWWVSPGSPRLVRSNPIEGVGLGRLLLGRLRVRARLAFMGCEQLVAVADVPAGAEAEIPVPIPPGRVGLARVDGEDCALWALEGSAHGPRVICAPIQRVSRSDLRARSPHLGEEHLDFLLRLPLIIPVSPRLCPKGPPPNVTDM